MSLLIHEHSHTCSSTLYAKVDTLLQYRFLSLLDLLFLSPTLPVLLGTEWV